MKYTICALIFVAGALFGSLANQITVNSVNKWLDGQSVEEQHDFVEARLKFIPGSAKTIAEHFCALNPNSRDICANAKLISPVRGK
jgi:hypothetical protein